MSARDQSKGLAPSLLYAPRVPRWHASVVAATTANVTLATDVEDTSVIDDVPLATGNRILVKNQTAPLENGIYVVAESGAPTRATDADSAAELVHCTVLVVGGTANANTIWTCTNDAITTAVAFAQFTSTTIGSIATGSVDMSTHGHCLIMAATDALTVELTLEDSADNVSFAAVADLPAFNMPSASIGSYAAILIAASRVRRYVRLSAVGTDTYLTVTALKINARSDIHTTTTHTLL